MATKQAATAPALTAEQLALLSERAKILEWLDTAIAREREIRRQIATELFPSPVEGVNKVITADGWLVTLDHEINRKLDDAALDSVMLQLPEDAPARVPGVLIEYKPKLVLSGYRALPEDQRKVFCQALTETPGMPKLVITKAPADLVNITFSAGNGAPAAAGSQAPASSQSAGGKKTRKKRTTKTK